MAEKGSSRDVSARKAVEIIKGPATNSEVMGLFRISAAGFADLLRQLYEKKLITEDDLKKRGVRFKLKRKKVEPKPVAEKPKPLPELKPPPPRPDDEEFVDTVTLTEMLTFKDPSQVVPETEVQTAEIEPPDVEPDPKAKKGKFKITGLFKRGD